MSDQKNLLVLTSSYPRFEGDLSAPYLKELYLNIKREWSGRISVLFPEDNTQNSLGGKPDGLDEKRFNYSRIKKWQTLAFENGILDNLKKFPWRVIQIPSFFYGFYQKAAILVRDCSIIHAHWLVPSGLIGACLKRKFKHLKLLITVHSSDLWLLEKIPFGIQLLKWVVSQADCVTAVNGLLAQRLMKHKIKTPIQVLSMGIYAKHRSSEKIPHQTTVLYLGRLVPLKGVRYLAEAAKLMPDILFLIAGEGYEKRNLAITYRDVSNIKFLGAVTGKEKKRLLETADIAVFPSLSTWRQEGMPVSLMEAMAAGLGIISTGSGGMEEVIEHMKNGLIVKEADSSAILKAILFLEQNRELLKKIGGNAQETSKSFDWAFISTRFISIYNQILLN